MSRNKPCNAATYRRCVADLIASEGARRVVEVGVFEGGLSRLIAEVSCVEHHLIVDPWAGGYQSGKTWDQAAMDEVAAKVYALAEVHPKIEIMRARSVDAARLLVTAGVEPFDVYHTDGDHGFNECRADIEAWLPLVRAGGLMTGDNHEAESVAAAVRAVFPAGSVFFPEAARGRVWAVRM